nr:unnamed protein product [Callosobruchus chinensis]
MECVPKNVKKIEVIFELVPPEGGWGHIITLAVIVMNLVTLVPLAAFGLVFGNFLASVGDETAGTTLSNGAYNTVQSFTVRPLLQKSESLCEDVIRKQTKPLLDEIEEGQPRLSFVHHRLSSGNILLPEKRVSIVSLGDRARSVVTVNVDEENEDEQKCRPSQLIDLSLLKDLKYLNIAVGLALSYSADVCFISIIPSVLKNSAFQEHDVSMMMTAYFGSDLACRIIYSVISGLMKIRNKHVFLAGTIFSAIFRFLLTMRGGYWWTMITLGVQGFLRCLIQTPLPLVISEEYHDNFSTAFSLFMVVCGFINLLFGPLMSYIKSVTGSDVMVIHLLTLAFSFCGVSWSSEMFYKKIKKMTKK